MISAVYDCAAVEKKMRHSRGRNRPRERWHTRTEVRTKHGDNHLGYVSPNGALQQGRAGILRELGLPSRNPPRPIGE